MPIETKYQNIASVREIFNTESSQLICYCSGFWVLDHNNHSFDGSFIVSIDYNSFDAILRPTNGETTNT